MNPVHATSIEDAVLELAPARAALYEFISAVLLQAPTRELLQGLANLPSAAERTAGLHEAVVDSLLELSRLAKEKIDSDAEMLSLRQDYMALFRVPGGKYVSPYESVYRDTREIEGRQVKGLLLGPSALDAQKWYRLAAAEMAAEVKELPDHIGVLVAFMGYLCRKEQEFAAMENKPHLDATWRIEQQFISRHVTSWLDELLSAVRSKSSGNFYVAALELLRNLLEQDCLILGPCLAATSLP